MIEEKAGKARVFDLDGTLLERGRVVRIFGLVAGRIRPQRLPNLTIDDIAKLDIRHSRVDGEIVGLPELAACEWHARKQVFKGVRSGLEKLSTEGVDIYGNTGRPNKSAWVDMTFDSLHYQGIGDFFNDIAFTPLGVRTAISKAHRLFELSRVYKEVEFDDDDPRTIRFLATVFPDLKFNYIHYRTSGLLIAQRELDMLGNVSRVSHVFGPSNNTFKI